MMLGNGLRNFICFSLFFFLVDFCSQEKSVLDMVSLKGGVEEYGTITKKTYRGIELKKDKESIRIDYDKIENYFFGESKSEFELIFDSLLIGNFVKASAQLSELETKIKRQVIKEDIKFYLAISYYYQKKYDKFFETIELLVKEFPDTYFIYNILSFIIDLLDVEMVKEVSSGLTNLVSQITISIGKQKDKKDTFFENTAKLLGGVVKENSGNYTEARDIYQQIRNNYSLTEVLATVAEILIAKDMVRNNNLNSAIKKLEGLKEELLKQGESPFLKNVFLLLGDIYRKQAEDAKDGKEKLLKKALYVYMNIYLLHIPDITELPEVYAKSMYYLYKILSGLAQTEKDENKKNEYLSKAQELKSELKQKYGATIWAGKLE